MRRIACFCCALLLLCSCQKAKPDVDKDLPDFEQVFSGDVENADDSFGGFVGGSSERLYSRSQAYDFREESVQRGGFYLCLPEGTDESHQDPASAIAQAVYTLDYDQEPGSKVKQLRYLTLSLGGEGCDFGELSLKLRDGDPEALALTLSPEGRAELPLDLSLAEKDNRELKLQGTLTYQGQPYDFQVKL